MKKHSFYFYILLCSFGLLTYFITPNNAEGQNQRVRIISADRLEGDRTEDDGTIRKLLGNVVLETDDFTIVSDSAYQYIDQDELRAFGNIRIDMENETIWSDYAYYHLGQEVSEFEGNVVMQGQEATLFSDFVEYSFLTKVAIFPNPLRLEDEQGSLVSDEGVYYNEQDSAVFRGHVQLADSVQYIEADSLFTNRGAGYYELFGRVFMDDFENRVRLYGDYVESDSTGYRIAEGNSRMRRINESYTDTTHINAHKLETWRTDTTYTFTGYDNVEIWAESYSSLSDSATYDEYEDLFTLGGDPKTWYDNIQLTGPHIEIQLEDDSVRSLLSYPRPFSVQEDTITGRLNQVIGDTIYVDFENGNIDYIDVTNEANLLYHTKDGEHNSDGAIDMTSVFITMEFLEGQLEDVKSYENINGTYFPESPDLSERRLDGFVWDPDLRPQRPQTEIQRRLDEIPEEMPFDLPKLYRKSLE
ncbi:MAG: OstA-like protein [Balneolales bacterium]